MKVSLSILLVFLSINLLAQGLVTGRIIDTKSNKAIPFASIVLKNTETTKILGSKATIDGDIKISDLPYGVYTATISSVGYQPKTISNIRISQYASKKKLGNITMVQKSKKLGTVVVGYEKKNIEIKADKKVFNVEKNISAEGGTLEDVLRNVPSVNVNADGTVSLRGKTNVTILVDGKQNPLFADLETALQSIPAESIASIEVITNPSAKYEAQGLGGIINIVMKEGKRKKGFSGTVNAGARYNFRTSGGANLNYRPNDKVAFFLNANGGTGNVWEENEYERTSYENDDTYQSVSLKKRKPRRFFGSFGMEYNLNKNNKLLWTNSIFRGSFDGDDTENIFERNGDVLNQYWFRKNLYNAKPSNTTTNLKWTKKFKKPKQKLNTEINLSKRSYIRESDYETSIYDGQNNLTTYFVQRNPIDGGNLNGAFQIDYEHPLGENSKIEFGERTYMMDFYSENFPTIQYLGMPQIEETILKNDFDFLQQVHGLYTNYSTKYKSYSFQVGLRGEYFKYEGTAAQLGSQVFTTDYLSLFPSAFIAKQIDKSSDINFNYSRRVNRPNFFQLLPFIRVNSPLDTSIGNPGLQPEFINAFELGYNKRYGKDNTFYISAYYQLTDNIIQRFRRFNPDGSTFSQTQNLANGSTFGLEITNQIYLTKDWDVTINANGFRNIIIGNSSSENQDFDGFGGFLKLVSNTKIAKVWQLQVSGNYFAPKVIVQGTRLGFGFMDLALKKSFFSKQLNLTLIASDIFNTNKTITEFDLFPSQFQQTMRNRQTQFFGFNLQYRFPRNQQNGGRRDYKGNRTKKRDDNLKDGDQGGY